MSYKLCDVWQSDCHDTDRGDKLYTAAKQYHFYSMAFEFWIKYMLES